MPFASLCERLFGALFKVGLLGMCLALRQQYEVVRGAKAKPDVWVIGYFFGADFERAGRLS